MTDTPLVLKLRRRIERLEGDLHHALGAYIEVVFYAPEDAKDPHILRLRSGGFCFIGDHLYNAGDEEVATYSAEDGKWFVRLSDNPDSHAYIYAGAEFTIGLEESA